MPSSPTKTLQVEKANVAIYPTRKAMGEAAAIQAAKIIQAAIAARGQARIIIATGNSQLDFIDALVVQKAIDWTKVEAFHMDEYVGIAPNHPASFRHWIKTRVQNRVPVSKLHYIEGDVKDVNDEVVRYSRLLNAAPVDLAFVGFGENGHIAFNDPPVADFNDPATLKVVTLEDACRRQQVGEGHFKDIASVPEQAITVTCPGLFRAAAWVCCVPERRKAEAVRNALKNPISTACPATIVRTHPQAFVYLDLESASLL